MRQTLLSLGVFLMFSWSVDAGEMERRQLPRPTPLAMPDISFTDEADRSLTLEHWRGKFVLLNIWATWCGPCRAEMPALDRLQGHLGSERFEVVALSVDRGGIGTVRNFFGENAIRRLRIYNDPSGRAARVLGVPGLPGTILVDPQGRELGRYIGAVEWDTSEVIAFLRGIIGGEQKWKGNKIHQR